MTILALSLLAITMAVKSAAHHEPALTKPYCIYIRHPMNKFSTLIFSAVVSSLCTSVAWAHGEKEHSAKAVPVKIEQKDWGIAGDAKAARRTIALGMGDNMRFTPSKITVKLGETVKFNIKNSGNMLHEFVIGTRKELDEHAALMLKFPNMEHDEPYMAHVPAGKTGSIVWTFNRAGEFDFACLIAGHYQAGMVGNINVIAKQ
jgi:uncharacterized cupredoxin-like copper-binding protein